MTIDERIAKLERKVWCQDVIIYELTSVLQRMKQEQGRVLYDEVRASFAQRLASALLLTGHATADIAPAQMWLFHLDPEDPLDVMDILVSSAPSSDPLFN
jgi:uncharacterized coiled-coil protein SlyX